MSNKKAWAVSDDGKEFWLLADRAWIRVYESDYAPRRTVLVRSNMDVLYELARCVRGHGHIALLNENPFDAPHSAISCRYLYA
jgi:hypothetical protein